MATLLQEASPPAVRGDVQCSIANIVDLNAISSPFGRFLKAFDGNSLPAQGAVTTVADVRALRRAEINKTAR